MSGAINGLERRLGDADVHFDEGGAAARGVRLDAVRTIDGIEDGIVTVLL